MPERPGGGNEQDGANTSARTSIAVRGTRARHAARNGSRRRQDGAPRRATASERSRVEHRRNRRRRRTTLRIGLGLVAEPDERIAKLAHASVDTAPEALQIGAKRAAALQDVGERNAQRHTAGTGEGRRKVGRRHGWNIVGARPQRVVETGTASADRRMAGGIVTASAKRQWAHAIVGHAIDVGTVSGDNGNVSIGIVTASAKRRNTRATVGLVVDVRDVNTGNGNININIGIETGSARRQRTRVTGACIIAVGVVNACKRNVNRQGWQRRQRNGHRQRPFSLDLENRVTDPLIEPPASVAAHEMGTVLRRSGSARGCSEMAWFRADKTPDPCPRSNIGGNLHAGVAHEQQKASAVQTKNTARRFVPGRNLRRREAPPAP